MLSAGDDVQLDRCLHLGVQANQRLTISIAGYGRVRHTGAAPSVSIVGSGDVRRG